MMFQYCSGEILPIEDFYRGKKIDYESYVRFEDEHAVVKFNPNPFFDPISYIVAAGYEIVKAVPGSGEVTIIITPK